MISHIRWLSTLFFLVIFSSIQSQILIFTYSHNRADFIEIQYKTLKKFFMDDYTFIVFNDANHQTAEQQIQDMCNRYAIECIRIPQEIHNRPYLQRWPGENYNYPTVRNVNVVQYSLDIKGFDHNDIVILLDSDMFLVKPLSIREFLNGYDMGGRKLGRGSRTEHGDIQYVWHGLTFLDMRTMPNKKTLNFNCGRVEGKAVDGGGNSHYYLKNNPSVKVRYIDHNFSNELQCRHCQENNIIVCTHNTQELINAGFDEHQITFLQSVPTGGEFVHASVEFFHNNSFLHYRCGSNWDGRSQEYHDKKTAALHTYINSILE